MTPRELRKQRRQEEREAAKARRKANQSGVPQGAVLELELPTGFRGGLILPLRVAAQLGARPFKWIKPSIAILTLLLVAISVLGILMSNLLVPWLDPGRVAAGQSFIMLLVLWFMYPFIIPPLLAASLEFLAGQPVSWKTALEPLRVRTKSLVGLGFLSIAMSGLTTAGIIALKDPSLVWAVYATELFWRLIFGLAATWVWSYDLKMGHAFKLAFLSFKKTWSIWLGAMMSVAFLGFAFSNIVVWSARAMKLMSPFWQNLSGIAMAIFILLAIVNALGLMGQLFLLLQSTAEEKIDGKAFLTQDKSGN